ncbi:hypothetical protein [Hyphomonas sp. UBA4494]|jgi:predicted Zn-dependent peptidase|uniref:hypothetical protein n=1 Tax=Hyphomonas sp. UBA4494 TaxID=1946631 RepID=UPI0025BB50D8|nr:hypothetical protein [Hyphomonas sp. UBA4494]
MAFALPGNAVGILAGLVGAAMLTSGAYFKGRADARGAQAVRTISLLAEERSTFRGVFATQVNATYAAVRSDLGNAEACIAALDASDQARASFRKQLASSQETGRAEAQKLSQQLRDLMAMQEDTNAGIAGAYDRLDPDIPCRVYGLAECYGTQPAAAIAYGVSDMEIREPDTGPVD